MLERWTADRVLALAPDAASQKAGTKLAAPGPWTGLGAGLIPLGDTTGDEQGGAPGTARGGVWGLCTGSGATAYRTVVDPDAPAWSCTCPSRKQPCKHALGLLLLWSAGGVAGDAADTDDRGAVGAPAWVTSWLTARYGGEPATARPKTERPAGGGLADPEAARRRAAQKAARVAEGVDELGRWLTDQVRQGLAGAERAGYAHWENEARSMVDAQAPRLAERLREAGTRPGSGEGWPSRLLEDYALMWLVLRAHDRLGGPDDAADPGLDGERLDGERLDGAERLAGLEAPLAASLRARIGWNVDSAELVKRAAEQGTAVRDHWTVLGSRDDEDNPTVRRQIWLLGERTGRTALVLAYGAAGQAPPLALPVGERFEADLVFHDAAAPLRAHLAERHGPPEPADVPAGCGAEDAALAYADALRREPWLDTWPVVLADVAAVPDVLGWRIVALGGDLSQDAADMGGLPNFAGDKGFWLPVDRSRCRDDALWRLAAMSGGAGMTVFGEYGARGFAPVTCWHEGRAVPL
ncbi:SWIM zinc finger family protein [Yinghuangia seranimata]|uniref:SWIM zinc finger family protein n=1 Tax=Yinghuangia seranimata TaxID=408067 RepID=UPI00248BE083|nr:SWIM zinc finger family protein [Yinghuangia seranimata]MDI2126796.1 SWIM zinc finger domain-containing protein [Yinghuangia seranimata]